jgi:putative peptidoglycan lipid II flippase
MLPQGMFSVAIATVLFPSLARLAARNDMDGFRETVVLGLRQIAFLLVPASVLAAVLADPITRLLYERGEFTADQTPVVAGALAAFAGGLVFNGAMLMLTRAFFSLQSNWIPTTVALANLGLNAAFNALFYRLGVWGIPLSTTVVNVIGTFVLFTLLQRRLGRLGAPRILDGLARVVAASVALAGVSYVVWRYLDDTLGDSLAAQILSLGAAVIAGADAYLLFCILLRVRELEAVLSLRARIRRRPR